MRRWSWMRTRMGRPQVNHSNPERTAGDPEVQGRDEAAASSPSAVSRLFPGVPGTPWPPILGRIFKPLCKISPSDVPLCHEEAAHLSSATLLTLITEAQECDPLRGLVHRF